MSRRAARGAALARPLLAVEARRLLALERLTCARREHVTVVSPEDRAAIGDFANLSVSPNGVDLEAFHPGAPRLPDSLVFSGNQGYFPNVDAALWFAREVLPRVRRERPQATFTIAGARPARALRRLERGQPGLRVAGEVANLGALLAGSAVAVAPLRAGTGQLFKIIEALACATPVVATPRALSGLELEPERHVLVAETPEAFAGQVLRLLGDAALRERLGAAGRELALARHGWERSVAALEATYAELLRRWRSSEA